MRPFITFYAPRYKRPVSGEKCRASVRKQTLVHQIQLFGPEDLTGIGIAGMYAQIPTYAPAVQGEYVHVLCDDDELASPTVVQEVRNFAEAHGFPAVIVVNVLKQHEQGGLLLPIDFTGEPIMGRIDLGCLIVRRDVWLAHCHQYGQRYEGDADFARALYASGCPFRYAQSIFFLHGAVMRGAAEVAC